MEDTPLASLSLTHVHYVNFLYQSLYVLGLTLTIHLEPRRSNLLPLRMASPRPPSPVHHIRDPDLVNA